MSSIITSPLTTSVWINNVTYSNTGSPSADTLPRSSSSECSFETRSSLDTVLLDYKQFLAARTIQSTVRGWLFRRAFRRENLAATTISRWWRGFNVRRNRYAVIEAALQGRIKEHYHDMSSKVQSLFRGWQTRMKFQDFQGMKQLRMQYAEDMLSTLVKCLRKVKKDHLLPGIYGLRGSFLLYKIEGLSFTFGYRFHNGRMRAAIAQKRALLATRRSDFRKAMMYTRAPYPGPDSVLSLQTDFCLLKPIGPQQQRVFLLYDKYNRDSHVKDIFKKVSARLRTTMALRREVVRKRFCKDLIRRVIRVTLKQPSHRRQSEMIDQLFDELLIQDEEYSCYCKPKGPDDVWCG